MPCRLGEIFIDRTADGFFEIRHRDDAGRRDLITHKNAESAGEIARYDDAGKYRPLKTAPNLRHGWRLVLSDTGAARRALDFFYPGRVAAFLAYEHGTLKTTPLRETLERQTGMYRVAARITDQEADELIARFCRSDGGCLRTILWKRDTACPVPSSFLPPTKCDPTYDQTGRGEFAVPLLCQEACNLLIGEARKVVKPSVE